MRPRHGRDRFHTVPIFSSMDNDFMKGNGNTSAAGIPSNAF